jgi:hypothetical protein
LEITIFLIDVVATGGAYAGDSFSVKRNKNLMAAIARPP